MALKISDKVIVGIAIDRIKDNLTMATIATRGAISIDASIASGDYVTEFMFDVIGDVVRRDPNTQTSVVKERLNNINKIDPKIYFSKHVFMTYTELARYGTSMKEMQLRLGKDLGDLITRYILQMGLKALRGGIESSVGNVSTSLNTSLELVDINNGIFLFGDKNEDIVTLVAPSIVVAGLVSDALASTADQVNYGAVYGASIGTLGRAIWQVDSDVLSIGGRQAILGLTRGALKISESEVVKFLNIPSNQESNMGVTMSTEGGYTIGVKGFTYDVGIANPTEAQLVDTASWSLVGQLKNSAGVLIVGA